ncbi:MAG: TonB-dependent receptor, partial [Bryobacterales bacterium]|nr:TonB-dependent receptor [Bryobacterales bacterium]
SLQDTVTLTKGAHSLRFGADLLQQRSRQFAPIVERGFLDIRAGGGFGAFANFLDDFAGSGGAVQRDFGTSVYYPSLKRLAFFGTDRWRATQSLTLTLGLRYEYFGTPMNSLYKSAAGALFDVDPVTFRGSFMDPSEVKRDLNNFSPSVGLAWSPSFQDGILGKLMGNRKTVVRTGYTVGYDSFFNNIASNAQTSTPNVISTIIASTTSQPRGLPGALRSLPATPRAASPADNQNLMSGNLRNPYVQRWSFGIQRQLPGNIIYDVSYVGSKGTRLFLTEDQNPLVPGDLQVLPQSTVAIPAERRTGRLDSLQGPRSHRTNGGDSNYHSLQMLATKRFSGGLQFTAAYTFAKLIDNGSEAYNIAAANSPLAQGVPPMFGGLRLDRGLSTFHRTHRAVFAYLYELPFYRSQRGLLGRLGGGWQLSGITTFESGVPLNVLNGVDADGLGGSVADRPDFNPNGIPGTRAIPNAGSPTGYVNPDRGNAAIDPSTARYIGVRFVAGQRQPSRPGNAGRNLEFTPGINNFNIAVTKSIRLTEGWQLQLRGDSYNVFNHPQYASPSVSPFAGGPQAIAANVFSSPAGQFLQPRFADGGGRVLRYELRLRF